MTDIVNCSLKVAVTRSENTSLREGDDERNDDDDDGGGGGNGGDGGTKDQSTLVDVQQVDSCFTQSCYQGLYVQGHGQALIFQGQHFSNPRTQNYFKANFKDKPKSALRLRTKQQILMITELSAVMLHISSCVLYLSVFVLSCCTVLFLKS